MSNLNGGEYSVAVQCSNCGYNGSIMLPLGTLYENPAYRLASNSDRICPHCGCGTLKKAITVSRPEYR